mgnify:CR=1 FL=1
MKKFKEILSKTREQLVRDRQIESRYGIKSDLIMRIEAMNSHPYAYKNVIGA